MKIRVRQELLRNVIGHATTPGIEHLIMLMETNSPLLIRWAFQDDNGGACVFTWLGLAHPATRFSKEPGPKFLGLCGLPVISHVIREWDSNPRFAAQFLKALKLELFYRKGVQSGGTDGSAGKHPNRASNLHRERSAVGR